MHKQIVLATHMGFCFGVRRAVDMVEQARNSQQGRITTLGPIIHNHQVVERHRLMGIELAHELSEVQDGTVVLSAHGVSPQVEIDAAAQGLQVISVTCPYVAKLHKSAVKEVQNGYTILLVGDPGHTEVMGTVGAIEHAGGTAIVISSAAEVDGLPALKHIAVLAQTTQKLSIFSDVVAALVKVCPDIHVINTICHATEERQNSALQLAKKVDAVVVIGGRNSANTRRLRDICQAVGIPAYHIETADEIEISWFDDINIIGITAGASTPDWLIEDVVKRVVTLTGAEIQEARNE